ncbi:MAG: hypothetical protein QF515_13050 [Pseudomonadales bacterium]|mgnify:CR=1 FL=1|nr:hypothetical protein [Pseudomonadales bacterium]|tara:strand:+ start:5202 stop:5564 length:363 start_codon:yes stop_codon:yes gene_type:complete
MKTTIHTTILAGATVCALSAYATPTKPTVVIKASHYAQDKLIASFPEFPRVLTAVGIDRRGRHPGRGVSDLQRHVSAHERCHPRVVRLPDSAFDGGLETCLLFHEGLELPCFAAFSPLAG